MKIRIPASRLPKSKTRQLGRPSAEEAAKHKAWQASTDIKIKALTAAVKDAVAKTKKSSPALNAELAAARAAVSAIERRIAALEKKTGLARATQALETALRGESRREATYRSKYPRR